MKEIEIYDTTLRDGTQAEEVNFSAEDKVYLARKLDEFGIDYIEGGWPGSNPRDKEFFLQIQDHTLSHSKIVAFGSTRLDKHSADKDPNLKALVESGVSVVTIFGKSWDFHVREALRISLRRNTELIEDSLLWLRPQVKTLFYDAEHFFDGYKANPDYALETLSCAVSGEAECLVLCDTNGGSLPYEIMAAIQNVREFLGDKIQLGIHCHNDAGLAVANTLAAVSAGVTHVQVTMNGFGERSGNADSCSVIPNLVLKMGCQCVAGKKLEQLTSISRSVYEIANLPPNKRQPYVGNSAFSHKGGIHVNAILRDPRTYEHILPELIGNTQRILLSDLAGKSNILAKAEQFGLKLEKNDPLLIDIVTQLKKLENQGFQFEGAEASFELLMRKTLGIHQKYFDLLTLRIIDQKLYENEHTQAEATVMVRMPNKQIIHMAALGNGLVNAMDNAIRKALEEFYPQLKKMTLQDYKVRVLSGSSGTGAKVRVLIESVDQHGNSWGTVGLSHDIVEASWQALADSIRFWLLKSKEA